MHEMHDMSCSVEENIKMQCLDEDLTMQKQVHWKKTKNKRKNLWYGQSVSSDPSLNATDASILCTYKKGKKYIMW